MKGRKPLPKNVKVIKGTFRPHREKNKQEPSKKKPISPSWLNKRAKQIFQHLVSRRLKEYNIDSRSYTESIATLASRLEEVERFDKILNEEGYFYESENSKGFKVKKEHPAAKLREKAIRHVHSLLAEHGLTPASINKISTGKKPKEKTGFEDF